RENAKAEPPSSPVQCAPTGSTPGSARRRPVGLHGVRPHERCWLLLEHRYVEPCKTYGGLDEDLYVTTDAEAFVKWHAGQLSWAEASRGARIRLDGPSWLVRAFPTWNGRSMFAHIRPD